jgi:glucose/arabinose dehydrogenase
VVFRQQPKLSTGNHFGGRLVFDGKGYLFIGLGRITSVPPQDLDKLQGKVVRLTETAKSRRIIPLSAGPTRPEIWSYGIRNPQGMAMNPWSDTLWLNEHGPRGGDEINIPQAGKTTAGRWRRTALTTAACRSRSAGQNGSGNRAPLYVWPVSRR